MKGFTYTSAFAVKAAIESFEKKLADGREIRDTGVRRYYNLHYTLGGWYTRWRYKHATPMEFCRKHSRDGFYGTWADMLYTVLDKDEQDLLQWWSWIDKDELNALKDLLASSEEGKILVDQHLAGFINKYGAIK